MFGEEYPFLRDVESPLSAEMLKPLDPRCRVVQFVSRLTDADFERLAAFLINYPEMPLRAYGSYVRRQRTNDAIHKLLPLPSAQRDGFEFR